MPIAKSFNGVQREKVGIEETAGDGIASLSLYGVSLSGYSGYRFNLLNSLPGHSHLLPGLQRSPLCCYYPQIKLTVQDFTGCIMSDVV